MLHLPSSELSAAEQRLLSDIMLDRPKPPQYQSSLPPGHIQLEAPLCCDSLPGSPTILPIDGLIDEQPLDTILLARDTGVTLSVEKSLSSEVLPRCPSRAGAGNGRYVHVRRHGALIKGAYEVVDPNGCATIELVVRVCDLV